MTQSIQCKCQQAHFNVEGKVLLRFICHCTICQNVYKAPYADVIVMQSKNIIGNRSLLNFKKYRKPPALNRGTCRACGNPVFGYFNLLPKQGLAFIPARTFINSAELPPAKFHIFYEHAVEPVADNLPKYKGYVPSELGLAKHFIKHLIT